MFFYRAGGELLRSEVPLASLLPAKDDQRLPAITLARVDLALEGPDEWLYHERLGDLGAPFRAVGKSGGRYLVRLFGLADFWLDREARCVTVQRAPSAPEEVIEPLFLEQVLPLFWSLVGRSCLHASAVDWGDGRAVAFAGRSRSGKSTLASSLVSTQANAALLADDCLVIDVAEDRVIAHPGHRSVRLLSDSAEALLSSANAGSAALDGAKRRVDLAGGEGPLPLARVYLLGEPPDASAGPSITALRPRDAVAQLAACLFRIDPDDRSRLGEELALLERIAARTKIARLFVPRRFDALAAVRETIAADLRQG